LVLTGIPAGRHILRVSKAGEKDDDRVIEIREDGNEQVIQAQLKTLHQGSQPSPSQGSGAGGSVGEPSSILPGIVACMNCGSRYAQGVKYCGRCGGSSFMLVAPPESAQSFPCPRCQTNLPPMSKYCGRCGLRMEQQQREGAAGVSGFNSSGSGVSSSGNSNSSGVRVSPPPAVGFVSNFPGNIPKPVEKICARCSASFPPQIKYCGRCGFSLD
jgi:ribosomal protein L40E